MEIRKLIFVLIAIIVLGALGFGSWYYFKDSGPKNAQKPEQAVKVLEDKPPKFLFAINSETGHPFDRPMAAISFNNKIYVSDPGKGKILVFDQNGKFEHYLKSEIKFKMPYGLAYDASDLYIADSGAGKIYVLNTKGNTNREFKTKGVKLITPAVLLLRSGILYVSDLGLHQVLAFDRRGILLLKYGKEGHSLGNLYFPHGLAVTPQNTLYVADSGNNRIACYTSFGKAQAFGSDNMISTPRGLATDWKGNIWAVAGMANKIQVYAPNGKMIFSFGDTGSDYGQLYLPNGIYIDQNKRIYVTEVGNKRVSVFGY